MDKKALIIGITGQDGSYLAEFLLKKNYEVHGMIRRASSINTGRIDHLYKDRHENNVKLFLHYGDLTDSTNLFKIISSIKPHEIYNLGAQSHVAVSFEMPEYTTDVDAGGTLRVLQAVKEAGLGSHSRIYQASTSELYGKVQEIPQTEKTPFYPRSPYAAAKLCGYWMAVNFREAYNMFVVNGILFNHTSPRRGHNFLGKKVTQAVANIAKGKQSTLYLGNLESKRDWGHANDYIEGMWKMLQAEEADDYVLATGETHSVREFVELAFKCTGVNILWKGDRGSVEEIGVDGENEERILVKIDPKYFRPTEVDLLIGDATKAKEKLGWEPKMKFEEIIQEMVGYDLNN